ncbi:hypothetical protein ABTZ99_43750 [Actinosynnema sp. NPDC002837]
MTALVSRVGGLAAVVAVIGLLPWLSGRDPALSVLRARSAEQEPTAEALDAVRRELGLDAGPVALFGDWLAGALRGDLGRSWVGGGEVLPSVLSALGVSLALMGAALVVALALAAALSASTVVRGARGTARARTGATAAVPAALPEFLLATVLLVVLSVWLGWFPPYGWRGPQHLVLPALALGLPAGGILGRLVDDALPAVFEERWVVLWRSWGCSPGVIGRAAARRALPAVLPQFGLVAVGLTGERWRWRWCSPCRASAGPRWGPRRRRTCRCCRGPCSRSCCSGWWAARSWPVSGGGCSGRRCATRPCLLHRP